MTRCEQSRKIDIYASIPRYDAVYYASTEPSKLTELTTEERACVDLFYNLCHEFPDSPR
jgi:hypothetical protein